MAAHARARNRYLLGLSVLFVVKHYGKANQVQLTAPSGVLTRPLLDELLIRDVLVEWKEAVDDV
jgi:hypothetical protein